MARWKLLSSHYLRVPGTIWEYTEQKGGKTERVRREIPMFLDVDDPSCWTQTFLTGPLGEGMIVVCYEGKGQPGDVTFIGEPTPEMLPLDDEARAISESFAEKWSYRPEDPGAVGYSQSLVSALQDQMAAAQTKPVEVAGLADLVASIGKLVESQQSQQTIRRV